MQWETEQPKQQTASVLNWGPIRISISPSHNGTDEQYQHFLMSFGWYSTNYEEKCLRQFPILAIAKAREALDEFEAALEAES